MLEPYYECMWDESIKRAFVHQIDIIKISFKMEVKVVVFGDGFEILDEFYLEFFILQKNIRQKIIMVIKLFFLFLKAFDPQNVHNMFVIMLDPYFKILQVVKNYVARGEVICFAFEYDGKITIPLLMTCFDRLNPISEACAIIFDVHVFQFEEENNMFGVGTSKE